MSEVREPRSVVLSGATGLVGGALMPVLARAGWEVRALSRSPARLSEELERAESTRGTLRALRWDGATPPPEAVAGSEAIVHLAGEPVFGGIPTAAKRARILDSRVESTRRIVAAIAERPEDERPRTFVCASAVGFYGDRGEEELTESATPGRGFLADVCRAWEAEAEAAEKLGVRVVRLRIGLVLAKGGGALSMMRIPFGLGLGGRLGDGRQWMPWVDLADLVRMIVFALDSEVRGALNATSPNPARNSEFTAALAKALGRPAFLPVPAFALRATLGELAGELLGSRRVLPAAPLAAGFEFETPDLADSLAHHLG